jgi:hypothetical protein
MFFAFGMAIHQVSGMSHQTNDSLSSDIRALFQLCRIKHLYVFLRNIALSTAR